MQHEHINWKRFFTTTARSALAISMATALTLSVAAGGNRETQTEEPTQNQSEQDSSRIEFEDGNQVDRESQDDDSESEDSADSEQPVWAIVDHPLENDLVNNISGILEDGYAPVGMDNTQDAISMLYAKSNRIIFDQWVIHEFTDLSNLNEEFSTFLLNGWTPMDISVTDSGLSTLFVQGEENPEITGWRIHEVPVDELESVFSVLQGYRDDGFLPYGVSIDQENQEFWFLMIQSERSQNTEPARVAFNAFSQDEVAEGITNDIANGLLPWGLARGRESSFVLYLF